MVSHGGTHTAAAGGHAHSLQDTTIMVQESVQLSWFMQVDGLTSSSML
jgi:hypothetical protein